MASLPEPGRVLGHYRIVGQVSVGGMGVVFRARDLRLERDVALKVLPPGSFQDDPARRQFRNEALTLSRLNHPNIAHVYDFDTEDGVDFLVMEYVLGITLSTRLSQGPLPEAEVISLGEQIASTLADAHHAGVVHCDIKPGNVMLTPAGKIKLLDFGLAQLLRTSDTTTTRSLSSIPAFAGTPPYMAPEQVRGGPGTFESDIYALGVSLYELATGRRPFENQALQALLHDIETKPPEPPRNLVPTLSPRLQEIILTCLAKEPAQRTYTATELTKALAGLRTQDFSPVSASLVRKLRVPALVVLALALAAGGYFVRPSRHAANSGVRHLAVLPMAAPGGSPEDVAFGNGLIETLTARLTQLGRAHGLEVIPASEIRGKKVSTLQEASVEFGVGLGLELSVERANDQMRVTYALVDAHKHQQINGDTITASAADPFALEDQVADKVVQALDLELQPQERQALTNPRTTQPAAYDYYLQGVGYLQDFHKPENVESAIAVFNHAIERDPNYALAYAGLGQALYYKHLVTHEHEQMGPAKEACERALALKPDEAAGHYCLGLVLGGSGQYEAAARQHQTASELDPSDDRSVAALADAYDKSGKTAAAEQTYRHAISLRPNDWVAYNWLGTFYMAHGRYEEAAAVFKQIISLAPDSYAGYSNLGIAYLGLGDYANAVRQLEQSVAIRKTADNTSNLATAYFALRQFAQAARTYEEAVALDGRSYVVWGNLGDAYYWAPGERAKAGEAYQKAIAQGNELLAINPRNHEVLAYLAQDYAMSGKRTEAVSYLKRALVLAPNDPETLKTAALVYNHLGDTDKALSYLEQATAAGVTASDLRSTPNFDNLRAFPRYQNLIATRT
jgi:serine/threonine-protein kinase